VEEGWEDESEEEWEDRRGGGIGGKEWRRSWRKRVEVE
jgi:hypothetical protein